MNETKEAILSFPPDPICKSSDPWYENESPEQAEARITTLPPFYSEKKTV